MAPTIGSSRSRRGRWCCTAPRRTGIAAPAWASHSPRSVPRRGRGPRATLWLGPDEYLLLDLGPGDGADGDRTRGGAKLERALARAARLVDVSHRQFALEISVRTRRPC